MRTYYCRIYHHAHGDEEYGTEQVLDACQKMLYPFSLDGFGKDGAHYESAQGGGKTGQRGKSHHPEAQTYGNYQQYFIVQVLFRFAESDGDDINADQEPQDQEKTEPGQAEHHLAARELAGNGKGGEEYHQQHGYEVLDHEGAENKGGVRLFLEPQIVESLDDNCRRTHGQQASQEDAFLHGPAQGASCDQTHDKHAQTDGPGSYERAAAYF